MGEGRLTMLSSKWAQRTYIIHNFQGDKCQSDVPWEYKLTEYSLWVVHIKSDSSLGCHKKQVVTNSNYRYHPNLEQEWNTIQYNRKFQIYSPWWGKRKKKKSRFCLSKEWSSYYWQGRNFQVVLEKMVVQHIFCSRDSKYLKEIQFMKCYCRLQEQT